MKNTKGYKIFNFIMKIVSWCVMSILVVIGGLLLTIVVLNKVAEAKGELSPMGLYTIISPSMTPDIKVYDVVFVVRKDPSEIEVGDIVSYYSTISSIGDIPVTHRVVEKYNTNTGISFRTKGDANEVVDSEIVMGERVIGTVRLVIPFLGRIQFFLASKGGWLLAILIPALGIIIYDMVKLVKLLSVKNKMKAASNSEDKTNRNKRIERRTGKETVTKKQDKYDKFKTEEYENYKKGNNSKKKTAKTRYLYDDELEYSKLKRIRERQEKNYLYEKDNSKPLYDDDSTKRYKNKSQKKSSKNNSKVNDYEEELNRLLDKLDEFEEKESSPKSDYYKEYSRTKRSSRK